MTYPQPTAHDMQAVRELIDRSALETEIERVGRIALYKTEALGVAIGKRDEAIRAAATANYKLGISQEREETLAAQLKDVKAERDEARRTSERWRRNFWWAVLVPAVLGLTAFWMEIGR